MRQIVITVAFLIIALVGICGFAFSEDMFGDMIGVLKDDRVAANEESARTSLKTIHTAFQAYYWREGNTYPQSLNDLTKSEPPYISNYLAEGSYMGYMFEVTDSSDDDYLVVAHPDLSLPSEDSGRYSYCVMKDGLIRQSPEGVKIDSYDTARGLAVVKE